MKIKISLFILLLLPMFLFSQNKNEYRKYTRYYFDHINWNGEQYDNSIKGVEIILEDLEEVDPELFAILNADVQVYKRKRTTGRGLMLLGTAVGAICFVGAADAYNEENSKSGTFLLGGLAAFIVGIGGGSSMKPDSRKFIYNFTQRLNENKLGKEVKFSVRPEVGFGNNSSIGLSLSLKF